MKWSTHLKLVVLLVHVSSFSVIFHMITGTLRVWFRLKLSGKITGLCHFVCAHACACIICLCELMILVPGVRQRLTLRGTPMSINMSSSILICILIVQPFIIVIFIVL